MTRGAPLWLAGGSRLATLPRAAARVAAVAIAVSVMAAALASTAAAPVDATHDAIVEAMRHGAGFYDTARGIVTADPGTRIPMPALALVAAAMPPFALLLVLCGVLAALLLAGWSRIATTYRSPVARAVAGLLALLGATAAALLAVDAPQRGWAALLLGWALLLRTDPAWTIAAALGCIAALVDPTAGVALAVLAVLAAHDARWREAAGWLAALGMAMLAFAAHLWAMRDWPVPADGAAAQPAVEALGAAAFPMLPAGFGGAAVVLALVGWLATATPLAARVSAIAIAGVAAAWIAGMPADTLAVAVLPLGLASLPDALRDLASAAYDRRRITVTRIPRRES